MKMHPIKLIWNITNKCGYNCGICATHSDRYELNLIEKQAALSSILSLGVNGIKEIDFAGGDPLSAIDSIHIIHDAIDALGKERVSVTTTGRGICSAEMLGEDLSTLLYNCEITIDCPGQVPNYLRNDDSYVTTNRYALKNVSANIGRITINVPVLDPDLDNVSIKKMVEEISSINVSNISVNLIRLMKVGRMATQKFPEQYSPEHFVNSFIDYSKNTNIKDVHIHCALRGSILGSRCNMLVDKIGIDCSGNVFSCAWGGYVDGYNKYNIYDNPFYIGNLLETPLLEVLSSTRAKQLERFINENQTANCWVCLASKDNCMVLREYIE